jgi:Putative prokaryotic signal transducing protein
MRCVYEAANNVEAHMVCNMLEQNDIAARVEGEYLTSGVGELPAAGLVRVMAEEADYVRARNIIREWEAKSPPESAAPPARKSRSALWFLAGVVVTLVVSSWVNRSWVSSEGSDFNGDGTNDEHFIYSGQQLDRIDQDRNFDGKVDARFQYDSHEWLFLIDQDDDFDGSMELRTYFQAGNRKRSELDSDGDRDRSMDIQEEYVYDVLATKTYLAPGSSVVRKREYFSKGLLASDEWDSDNDGRLDTIRKYDRFAEIIETTRK